MTALLEMGDSSAPVTPPAPLPVYGVYIGGDTPHVWTPAEIKALSARWALPIVVHTDPGAAAMIVADDLIAAIHRANWPRGSTVVLDTESVVMPNIVETCDAAATAAGYFLMEYESKGPSGANPPTAGGRWVADWTGIPHLYPGSRATQYADPAIDGKPWDASLIEADVPLAEIHPPATHPVRYVDIGVRLPELTRGAAGPAVRRAQHLLIAWNPDSLGGTLPDGLFGPATLSAVRSFQRVYGLTADPGTIDGPTWARLITG